MKKVAIITRTKNRPLMLQRAFKSVADQVMGEHTWIVVNDGGDPKPVNKIVKVAKTKGLDVDVIHNNESRGMEAASNIGINASASEYVVIHDDDDSWQPTFLKETVGFLDKEGSSSLTKGVLTRTNKFIEVIEKDSIQVTQKMAYNPSLEAVTLFQMAHLNNIPPPISFLYRRKALSMTGLYRDDLPVLGDWEFNLRFLTHYNIGVIPEYLANYHWRRTLNEGAYGNTIIAKQEVHARYAAEIRNELIRSDLTEGKMGLGFLVNICHDLQALENIMAPLAAASELRRNLLSPFKAVFRSLKG